MPLNDEDGALIQDKDVYGADNRRWCKRLMFVFPLDGSDLASRGGLELESLD